ncbi:Low temperature requirement protein LtrA [Micromonospora viridifaciens]|uniref:Low temperature requirement protein LtrA n=1 Tax=Micromonospora viridifaciens TaxID=1881 RepID=A0A1C4XLC2_MICVI|nr:low temperature requirement protein A [Micromonospora viridifaciens]SCF09186.1 Low temperature requirement protein LtrA [Micromonospora viridifaciens]
MSGERRRGGLGPAIPIAPAARVDKFEVFFDLVFVVSFFIITRATAANVTGRQLLHALLVLAVLWWCWVVHSVVATRLRLGEGFVPVLMIIGMIALFTFALALPQTFGDGRQNPGGPILVTISYVVFRAMHLVLYAHSARGRPEDHRQLYRLLPEAVITAALLLLAALLPIHIADANLALWVRDGLWIAVVVIQYGSGLLVGPEGWEITSAEHWTERYDLILIIALGESVISIGVGGNLLGKPVTWPAVVAAMLGILFTAALWWTHFDVIGPAARIALHAAQGAPRVTMARDAWAYLYLPLIAGVILFALGAEELVATIVDPVGGLAERGRGSSVPVLVAGVMIYLAADMAFQLRTLGTVTWMRVGALVALAGGLAAGQHLPALAALVLLTVLVVSLAVVEVVVFADSRDALRRAVHEEKVRYEAGEAAWRARWHDEGPAPPTQ